MHLPGTGRCARQLETSGRFADAEKRHRIMMIQISDCRADGSLRLLGLMRIGISTIQNGRLNLQKRQGLSRRSNRGKIRPSQRR